MLALGPVVIVWTTSKILGVKTDFQLLIAVYLITYTVYSFDRLIDLNNESSDERTSKIKRSYNFRLLLVIISAIISLLLLKKSIFDLIFGSLLILFGLTYGIFFKKFTKLIVGFKSFFVAAIFASVVIFLIDNNVNIYLILLMFSFFFLRWFINTSFCDIKDRLQDQKENLKTFAATMTENNFIFLILVFNLISIIPIIYGVIAKLIPSFSLLILLVAPYYLLLIYLLKKRYNLQSLTNVWADSETIIWFVTIFIGGACSGYLDNLYFIR